MTYYSDRTRVLKNPTHSEEWFTTKDGSKCRVHIESGKALAQFYDAQPEMENSFWYKNQGDTKDWHSDGKAKYIPEQIRNGRLQARQITDKFILPDFILREANGLSRELVGAFSLNEPCRIQRKTTYGRFDTRAMPRVVKDIQRNKFSVDHTKPYMNFTRKAPKRPSVYILAAGNWSAMWSREDYIPDAAALALGVLWGCQAIQCECFAGLVRRIGAYGNDYVKQQGETQNPLGVMTLASDTDNMLPNEYAPFFHRDLYRCGTACLTVSHHDTFLSNHGRTFNNTSSGDNCGNESADEHCQAVAWARQRGADIVIAIGKFDDASDADIHIKNAKTSLRNVMEYIGKELYKVNESYRVAI